MQQKAPYHIQPSVLISGASSGIGQCCALTLAQRGFQVFAGYRQPQDAQTLKQRCPDVIPVPLELTDPNSIEAALKIICDKRSGKGLDGLVNNAGVVVSGPLEFTAIEQWRYQLEVNLIGQIALIQQCLPLLRQNRGRIVNMGSVAGIMTLPFLAPYSVSKLGLAAITDALRLELKPWGIHVSLIEPGSIDTPIWEKSLQATEYAEQAYAGDYRTLYGPSMAKIKTASQRAAAGSIAPQVVARAVLHALTASNPKTRYPIGLEVKIRRLLAQLPDALRDWLIAQQLSL